MAALGGVAHSHGFFSNRLPVNLDDGGGEISGLAEYVNVPPIIGQLVSMRMASYADLSTTLSVEDVHDLLEVAAVDVHNTAILRKREEQK